MYASTSARRASASIRRAPSRTISSITDDAADRAAPEPSRSAESETTVSIGSYLPDQRCRAGLAWNLSSVTREGTPHPKPIHRFQALLVAIAARYKGYRYPIEVIGHAVWLYHRFTLSLCDVEELMLARGVVVSYETIRYWCAKFGPDYAAQLRRWRPRPGDKWHLDEVFVKINGTTHYLWRAGEQTRALPHILGC